MIIFTMFNKNTKWPGHFFLLITISDYDDRNNLSFLRRIAHNLSMMT